MLRRLLAVWLLVLSFAACLPPAKTGCRTSDDCSQGRVCILGTCHDGRLDGGQDGGSGAETATDLTPRWQAADGPVQETDMAAFDIVVKRDGAEQIPDAQPVCPGGVGCATASDVPSDGALPVLDAPGKAASRDAPDARADTRLMSADASERPADTLPDVAHGSDRPTDALPDLTLAADTPTNITPKHADASDSATAIRPDLSDASDLPLDSAEDVADASDAGIDLPADLTEASDEAGDPGVPTTDAATVDHGLDSGVDGAAPTCVTNDDCELPRVCNINIDSTCGLPVYTQVDVGAENTCAVVSDGTLRCWGSNTWGQLGPETNVTRPLPFPVPGRHDVRMVATGWGYTCVLLRDGQVDCWGANFAGELGCANPADSGSGPLCTPYPAGSPIAQLVAGAQRPCVRRHDGVVECWGRNDHYDLGNGTDVGGPTPTAVFGISDATAIATGVWQGCAVIANGSLQCWGPNNRAQLGNGTLDTIPVPTTVSGLDGASAKVQAAATAEDHSCALLADGSVRCFGENIYGELGNGDIAAFSTTPVPCAFSQPAAIIASGIQFTCAALHDGSVECLGRGDVGQLGNGADTPSLTPVKVALPVGTVLRSIATKYSHVCALDVLGQLWCWGANESGQLGNGSTIDSNVPVLLAGPAGV